MLVGVALVEWSYTHLESVENGRFAGAIKTEDQYPDLLFAPQTAQDFTKQCTCKPPPCEYS